MTIKDILNEELNEISLSPEEDEAIGKKVEKIITELEKEGLEIKMGGSLAKGTIIKKDIQDIDLFILFKKNSDLEKLEEKLEKTKLNFSKLHGSRDYFQIEDGSFIIELIPVIKISKPEESENVTDLSLMHVDYVIKKIRENGRMVEEIKLAKAFCYSKNCYGAESYIKGFSGYALELLVIYFGSFINFLKKIDKERVIDPGGFYKNEKEIRNELNESKLLSPVILIDPTYKIRNACSSLSNETFNKFIKAAKEFLKKPSINSFDKEIIDIEKIQKQAKEKKALFIELALHTEKQGGDIAATKMKKFFDFIINELKRRGQEILFNNFMYESGQDAEAILIIKENQLLEFKGPPIKMKEAADAFKRIHKKTTAKKGFIFAKKPISLEEIFNHLKSFEDEMSCRFEVLKN
jgi:tRNA nucleotidyltransferase (CCA-adding enzyme)